jgi:hypothetical protein
VWIAANSSLGIVSFATISILGRHVNDGWTLVNFHQVLGAELGTRPNISGIFGKLRTFLSSIMRPLCLFLMAGTLAILIAACVWPAGSSLQVCRAAMGLCDYPFALFVTFVVWTGLFLGLSDQT